MVDIDHNKLSRGLCSDRGRFRLLYMATTEKRGRAKRSVKPKQPENRVEPDPVSRTVEAEPPMSRQELFCRLIALANKTPFEAYLEAFEWKGLPRQAHNAADALMLVPEIEQRIEELQPFQIELPMGEDMLTLGEHLRELAQLERIAVRMGQIGAAVNAAIHRGRASGLYVERSISAKVTLEDLLAASRRDGQVAIQQDGHTILVDDATGHAKGRRSLPGPASVAKRTA